MHNDSEMLRVVGADIPAAIRIARAAHAGQTDKSGASYFEHCERVALKVADDEAAVVALLHDVLEDTTTTEDELRDAFATEIVDAVVVMTRIPGESSDDYYRRVRSNPLALRVKLADLADNMDPERLAALDEETRQRLRDKYEHARSELST